jgi:hypothetical protein
MPWPIRSVANVKDCFIVCLGRVEFIRSIVLHSNKTLLFLLAALTLRRAMMRSSIRSITDQVAEFDGAAFTAKKR